MNRCSSRQLPARYFAISALDWTLNFVQEGPHKAESVILVHRRDGFKAAGLGFDDITHVFCTHLHIDHTGWNTKLVNGRWVPTFPKAKYIFHKDEYAFWEQATKEGKNPPGNVWTYNCRPIVEAGQALLECSNVVA